MLTTSLGFHMPRSPEPWFSVYLARLLFPSIAAERNHPPPKDDFLAPLLTSSQEISINLKSAELPIVHLQTLS